MKIRKEEKKQVQLDTKENKKRFKLRCRNLTGEARIILQTAPRGPQKILKKKKKQQLKRRPKISKTIFSFVEFNLLS